MVKDLKRCVCYLIGFLDVLRVYENKGFLIITEVVIYNIVIVYKWEGGGCYVIA